MQARVPSTCNSFEHRDRTTPWSIGWVEVVREMEDRNWNNCITVFILQNYETTPRNYCSLGIYECISSMEDKDLHNWDTLTNDIMESDVSCAESVRHEPRRAITAPCMGPVTARDEPVIKLMVKFEDAWRNSTYVGDVDGELYKGQAEDWWFD